MTKALKSALIAAAILSVSPPLASAQDVEKGEQPPAPAVPPPGEPRAQEQLPEAPPEQILKTPPPIEKKDAPVEPAKPAPDLPNTLPPADKKVEPKVPNT